MPAETGQISFGSVLHLSSRQSVGSGGAVDAGGEIWAAKRAVEAHLAACAKALFCEPFAWRRRRFARGAGITRPQRCEHDADLYACRSKQAEGDPSEVSSAAIISGLAAWWRRPSH